MSNHHERPEDDDEGRQIKEYWRDHSAAPFPSSAAAGAGASTGFQPEALQVLWLLLAFQRQERLLPLVFPRLAL